LLHPNLTLDKVFDAICVPTLLAYESDCVDSHDSASAEFKLAFEKEILSHRLAFSKALVPAAFRVHLILFPMGAKAKLMEAFDERLKACQMLA
jgi:hypothetical protein